MTALIPIISAENKTDLLQAFTGTQGNALKTEGMFFNQFLLSILNKDASANNVLSKTALSDETSSLNLPASLIQDTEGLAINTQPLPDEDAALSQDVAKGVISGNLHEHWLTKHNENYKPSPSSPPVNGGEIESILSHSVQEALRQSPSPLEEEGRSEGYFSVNGLKVPIAQEMRQPVGTGTGVIVNDKFVKNESEITIPDKTLMPQSDTKGNEKVIDPKIPLILTALKASSHEKAVTGPEAEACFSLAGLISEPVCKEIPSDEKSSGAALSVVKPAPEEAVSIVQTETTAAALFPFIPDTHNAMNNAFKQSQDETLQHVSNEIFMPQKDTSNSGKSPSNILLPQVEKGVNEVISNENYVKPFTGEVRDTTDRGFNKDAKISNIDSPKTPYINMSLDVQETDPAAIKVLSVRHITHSLNTELGQHHGFVNDDAETSENLRLSETDYRTLLNSPNVDAAKGALMPEKITEHAEVHRAGQAEEYSFVITKKTDTTLEVSIEPEGIGKVEIELSLDKGVVNANINVSDVPGKEAIERNINNLLNALLKEGITIGGFSVSLRERRQEIAKDDRAAEDISGEVTAKNMQQGYSPKGENIINIFV
ncbi:MAG: flagellar hook-length control protein FliK [Nitrospirae bacterium]|nr:flagellar hook-length control protein FliK [Nitrospirota bacterium]